MTEIQTDVCVVGGGPAGCVAAIRLATLGHAVCVIERHVPPRRRVGESISPGIWAQLALLGLGDRVERAGFLPMREADVLWAAERVEHVAARGPGLLVDRARFDALLLAAAAERGVRIVAPASAQRVARIGDGWRLDAAGGGGQITITARCVADASGRRGFLVGERRASGPSTLALYGYWRGDALPARTQVEARPDAWLWGAPMPDGSFNAMVFVDTKDPRVQVRAGLEAAYREQLARSDLLAACGRALLAEGVYACDATPYSDVNPIGAGWIKLGDAGAALDPLSSTGVEKAVQTALVGSIVVHTMLTRPASAALAEQLYRNRQAGAVMQHSSWAAGHYSSVRRYADHPFWHRRAISIAATADVQPPATVAVDLPDSSGDAPALLLDPSNRIALSPRASFSASEVPCIDGEFVAARRALVHPRLARPIVFLDEIPIVPLLEPLYAGTTVLALMRAISAHLPLPRALRVAGWLCHNDIVVAG